jgi:hypothetical protein
MKKTKQKLLLLIGVMIIGNSPPVFAGIWDVHDANAPVEKDASSSSEPDGPPPPPPPPGEEEGPPPPPSAPINTTLPLLIITGIAMGCYSYRIRKSSTKQ